MSSQHLPEVFQFGERDFAEAMSVVLQRGLTDTGFSATYRQLAPSAADPELFWFEVACLDTAIARYTYCGKNPRDTPAELALRRCVDLLVDRSAAGGLDPTARRQLGSEMWSRALAYHHALCGPNPGWDTARMVGDAAGIADTFELLRLAGELVPTATYFRACADQMHFAPPKQDDV